MKRVWGDDYLVSVSVGICAYNEEKNIGKLLQKLLDQQTNYAEIKEIIVVSSACTDRTNEIARDISKKDKRIKLVTQEKKEGKASAINCFIKEAKSDILVLESADTLPLEETIEYLVKPFLDPEVGITCGRPIPLNDPDKFLGFIIQLIWRLHHEISLKNPKPGELIAFRNIIKRISENTLADEDLIRIRIERKGYKVKYCPKAISYNRGPETISDLIKQRKRNNIGLLELMKNDKYKCPTMNIVDVAKVILKNLEPNSKLIVWTCLGCLLEGYIRLLAIFDFYLLKKDPYNWDVVKSTKKL